MEALRHMKSQKEMQEQSEDDAFFIWSNQNQSTNNDDSNPTTNHIGSSNRLCISIYLIGLDIYKSYVPHEKDIKLLLQHLSFIHGIIHKALIPSYNKKYQHCWYNGGEGVVFGMHCQDIHRSEANDKSNAIPHLRSVVHYGSNIMDEYLALAMMYALSSDLHQRYGIKVGIECWDLDDGHILLIEGADSLPTWVDDEVGVEGMNRRVYITNGRISIIPNTYKQNNPSSVRHLSGCYNLSRREALQYLEKECTSAFSNFDSISSITHPAVDKLIDSKLRDFLRLLRNSDDLEPRVILKEYLHTAAIVLPLRLALMIESPNIILPTLISSFCRHCTNVEWKQGISGAMDIKDPIPFEELVVTKVTLPKTLFAMLLTGAGRCPPPYKIPVRYKTIEMKRLKRKFENGGSGFDHFRHSMEAGVRLALGYEWLLMTFTNSTANKPSSSTNPIAFSVEDRITTLYPSLIHQMGGNPAWVQSSWKLGPNFTAKEDSIDSIINCPVWNPEIVKGGAWPLSKPGRTMRHLMADHYSRYELNSTEDFHEKFPMPRPNEVDSDYWLDFHSINELDAKMNDIISPKVSIETQSRQIDENTNDQKEKTSNMESIIHGLDHFMNSTSDIEGVSSISNQPKESYDISMDIDQSLYLHILHKSMKLDVNEKLELENPHSDHLYDPCLMDFFSKDDLEINFDTDDDQNEIDDNSDDDGFKNIDSENGICMRDLMVSIVVLYNVAFCESYTKELIFKNI